MTIPAPGTQVFRHSSDAARWEMVMRPPDLRLRRHVSAYVGYDEWSRAPLLRLEVPKTTAILILNIGAPIRIIGPGGAPTVQTHRSFVAGMYDSWVITETPRAQRGIEVKLTPLGAYRLLGRPMSELTNQVVALDDLFGAAADELVARLAEADTWEDCFLLMDDFLARRLAAAPPASREVAFAWQQLKTARGAVSIGGLARELGWSRKRLIERFRGEIGLTPKVAARLLRFTHALELLDADQRVSWADVAAGAGYYDQAHFIREFRSFAGLSPGDYRRRLLPDSGGVSGI